MERVTVWVISASPVLYAAIKGVIEGPSGGFLRATDQAPGRTRRGRVVVVKTFPFSPDELASLKAARPEAPIVVFCLEEAYLPAIGALLGEEIAAVLGPHDKASRWVEVLERVARGERLVSGPVLSPREKEVLYLLARGATSPEITEELVVSLHTAKSHLQHIYRKLGVSNRTQAAQLAQAMLPREEPPEGAEVLEVEL